MQKSGTVTKSLRIGKTLTKGTGEEGPLGTENEKQSGFFCAETKGNWALKSSKMKAVKESLCF